MRPDRRSLLLLAVSIGVALLIGEGIARRVSNPTLESSVIDPHPLLGWLPRPHGRVHVREPERKLDYHVHLNGLGLRDAERGPKRPDERRVLVLGDSFVYGMGVEVEDRCTERLESSLDRGTAVLNAGVPGWGPDQEYLWFRSHGLALEPDVVVLVLCLANDIVNVGSECALYGSTPKPHCTLDAGQLVCEPPAPRPRPSFRDRLSTAVSRSRLLYVVAERWHRLRMSRRPQVSAEDMVLPPSLPPAHWDAFRRVYGHELEAAFQVTEALVTALADSCAAHGIPFVLTVFPSRIEVDAEARAGELRRYGLEEGDFDLEAPWNRLDALAARLGIPFVDPRPALAPAEEPEPLFLERDAHPSPAGHAAFARALAPMIRNALLSL